ncbi:MAG: NUDIX hydrolase [Frankiales bacterium]|nr:NUDIX hydrolase [Frankiales bacterium]
MSRHVQAAGGVLWRRQDGGVQVAVVHRPRYDDWSLPKGKLDDGELAVIGAQREVMEETGYTGVVGRTLGHSSYRVLDQGRDVPKTVRWWAMRCAAGTFVPTAEVDHLQWLSLPEAMRRVSANRDDRPLELFAAHPPETTTVLVLRHGSAGNREDWDGADDDRPLDAQGLAQAAAAATVLTAYAPTVLRSAPPRRCLATVEPLARTLGVRVEPDPELSDLMWHKDPTVVVAAVRGLGARTVTTVAVSQGGAIQQAVGSLADQAGLSLDRVRARKGSLWALSFSRGRLLDLDYTADLTGPG